MKRSPLIEAFGDERRWVNWKLLRVKDKLTKIPYAINGRKASSTDAATWATFEDAEKASKNVGIVFTPDQMLLGIDIDHCLKDNKIEHEQKENIEKFVRDSDTYAEISPSGEGLHIFLKLTAPLALGAHKRAPYEAYTSGRYFTVTHNAWECVRPVREVGTEEALALLGIIGYPWKKEEEDRSESVLVPISLDDSTLLTKMFASKNGKAVKALYGGDTSAHDGDDSAADMALCSHLAFWTGRNGSQMERLWLASPLGQRKKTQTRAPYRASTIKAAVVNSKDVYSISSERKVLLDTSQELDLLYTMSPKKDKVFTQNTENMCRILRHHKDFKGRFRYDEFKTTMEIQRNGRWQSWEDGDDVNTQTAISIIFPFFGRVGKEMVFDAMVKVARENAIDSAGDYIRAIQWDKKARLDDWLSSTYGTPKDAYHKAVASNWMKGLVKRIIEPGCKFDYVLVLEGPQGTKKSTSLSILGGKWHVETTMSTDSKDFFMQFQGKSIIEFSEGETMSRTEVKKMKAIITTQVDRYRAPWGKTSQDFPRRCVFAMTTNQEEYLKDETGNRRWLPVRVVLPEADVAWLEANRDQLFAEAYHRLYTKKETTHDFPKEATLDAQNQRRIHYEYEDPIIEWYFNKLSDDSRAAGITVFMAYRDVLNGGYTTKPLDKFTEMRIVEVFKNVLKLTNERKTVSKIRTNRWIDVTLVIPEQAPLTGVDKEFEDIIKEF